MTLSDSKIPSDTFKGTWIHVSWTLWWKSATRKLTKYRLVLVTKLIPGCIAFVRAPILPPPLGRPRPKFPKRCCPLTCACVGYQGLSGSVPVSYSRKTDLSELQSFTVQAIAESVQDFHPTTIIAGICKR